MQQQFPECQAPFDGLAKANFITEQKGSRIFRTGTLIYPVLMRKGTERIAIRPQRREQEMIILWLPRRIQ
ncbi:MAG: hypothetical protein BGO63_06895 [Candidatus Accumulibacter sp. 66-26]|nr:MAG: hypothetical protein BGO63_06895 [Candidatus Accumulibacter sp. 66-26]